MVLLYHRRGDLSTPFLLALEESFAGVHQLVSDFVHLHGEGDAVLLDGDGLFPAVLGDYPQALAPCVPQGNVAALFHRPPIPAAEVFEAIPAENLEPVAARMNDTQQSEISGHLTSGEAGGGGGHVLLVLGSGLHALDTLADDTENLAGEQEVVESGHSVNDHAVDFILDNLIVSGQPPHFLTNLANGLVVILVHTHLFILLRLSVGFWGSPLFLIVLYHTRGDLSTPLIEIFDCDFDTLGGFHSLKMPGIRQFVSLSFKGFIVGVAGGVVLADSLDQSKLSGLETLFGVPLVGPIRKKADGQPPRFDHFHHVDQLGDGVQQHEPGSIGVGILHIKDRFFLFTKHFYHLSLSDTIVSEKGLFVNPLSEFFFT
ncbi:MAG TPA: hypothetical protein [Caudoviricetes sp.]|nr:MAG TPA: hypothetical protein [Caudoviricetes sp.]